MKLTKPIAVLALVALLVSPLALARGNRGDRASGGRGQGSGAACLDQVLQDLPFQELDDQEIADLTFSREEEKLARDVYLALDDMWGLRVFRNIAAAEQKHMDTILTLLDKYSLVDPVATTPRGVFGNEDLQALYYDLVAQGEESLIAALTVGATIEDLDIQDLLDMMERTDNEDLMTAYQNLVKGSRNHMRAFGGLLQDNGVTYTPQYITQLLFDEIMSSPKERGMVDADGNPMSCPSGGGSGGQGGPGGPGGRGGRR